MKNCKSCKKSIVSGLNDNQEYMECKLKLENIYQIKVNGTRTRS